MVSLITEALEAADRKLLDMTGPNGSERWSCLVIEEDGAYVAVLLEHLMSAQGDTIEQALERLGHVVRINRDVAADNGWPPIADMPPASAEWWTLWQAAKPLDAAHEVQDLEGVEQVRLHLAA